MSDGSEKKRYVMRLRGTLQKGEHNHNWKGGVWAKNPKEYHKNKYSQNPSVRELIKKRAREFYHNQRWLTLTHYSSNPPECKCCGEKEVRFLSLDHINGGGRKHRESLGVSGQAMYRWIVRNNFPEGFQILCHNCNQAKGYYGECPHQKLNVEKNGK